MARKIDTFTKLANDLEKGILHPMSEIRRDLLNPSELNQLKLLDSHIDSLMELMQGDIQGLSDTQRVNLELDAVAADEFEDGYLIRGDTTYATLKTYIDVLNKNKPKENQYHLGHETAIFTTYLKLLRENYKPKPGSEIKNKIIKRQRTLIDNALRASIIIDSIDEAALVKLKAAGLKSGQSEADLRLILEAAGFAVDLDTHVERDLTGLFKTGKTKITLTAELGSTNLTTGNLTGNLSRMFRKSFGSNKAGGTVIDDILAGIDPTNIKGSPSIKSYVGNTLVAKAKGIKISKHKLKSEVRLQRRLAANNTVVISLKKRINKKLVRLQGYAKAKRQKKKFIIPTVSIKALINESLAEFIRIRMGKSNDQAIKLRNQTGRFSESARLLTLNRNQAGALLGTYDFAKDPYGVFLPGGRLHTQQRDPKLYIEGAIRDISARILKRQFRGIALELK